jgi:hypothetical protein
MLELKAQTKLSKNQAIGLIGETFEISAYVFESDCVTIILRPTNRALDTAPPTNVKDEKDESQSA